MCDLETSCGGCCAKIKKKCHCIREEEVCCRGFSDWFLLSKIFARLLRLVKCWYGGYYKTSKFKLPFRYAFVILKTSVIFCRW